MFLPLALAAGLAAAPPPPPPAPGVVIAPRRATTLVVSADVGAPVERAVPSRAYARAIAADAELRWSDAEELYREAAAEWTAAARLRPSRALDLAITKAERERTRSQALASRARAAATARPRPGRDPRRRPRGGAPPARQADGDARRARARPRGAVRPRAGPPERPRPPGHPSRTLPHRRAGDARGGDQPAPLRDPRRGWRAGRRPHGSRPGHRGDRADPANTSRWRRLRRRAGRDAGGPGRAGAGRCSTPWSGGSSATTPSTKRTTGTACAATPGSRACSRARTAPGRGLPCRIDLRPRDC